MREKPETLHISLTISVNRENYGWSEPKGSRSVEFAIPVEMFSGNLFSKMVEEKIKESVQEFKKAQVEQKEESVAVADVTGKGFSYLHKKEEEE